MTKINTSSSAFLETSAQNNGDLKVRRCVAVLSSGPLFSEAIVFVADPTIFNSADEEPRHNASVGKKKRKKTEKTAFASRFGTRRTEIIYMNRS